MKSIKNETKPPQTKPAYPCLKITKPDLPGYRTIIMFTKQYSGVVVWRSGRFQYQIGVYSETWDEPNFEPYHGSITLYSDDPMEA